MTARDHSQQAVVAQGTKTMNAAMNDETQSHRRSDRWRMLTCRAAVALVALTMSLTFLPAGSVKSQAATVVGGYPMPSLEDERRTYLTWSWTWAASKEPHFTGDSAYAVRDPDIHGDTEGDDLWTYLMMYLRTGQQGYLDRARAWARYFINDYRQCVGSSGTDYCYDRDAFDMDHIYGWGLVAWYEYTGDTSALTAAENLAGDVENYWSHRVNNAYPTPGQFRMAPYGLRQAGRQLLLVTRVAEATGKARWIALRDKLIDLWMQAPDWDSRGMYFGGAGLADDVIAPGAYAQGARIVPTFHVGILTEAFAHVYRTTGRTDVRDRMVAMARFVSQYGLDARYQYSGKFFGFVNGAVWHNYSAVSNVTYWDPVYTTALVNSLAYGCKFASDQSLCDRARVFFNRGTKGIYGEPILRDAADNVVSHFYLDYNKGELQYTYLVFESPTAPRKPMPPTNLRTN
jgi:hypothetical protein